MRLLDRLRDLRARAPEADQWDDAGVEEIAAHAKALASAWDADPDDGRSTSSRAVILGAFAAETSRRSERDPGAAGRITPLVGAAPGIRRGGRRTALMLLAACALLALSVGAVAASAAGGPLYDIRVSAEGLLLPRELDDRAAAQVARLQTRVAEAIEAAGRGDTRGVSATLEAYARIASEAAVAPVGDSATLTGLAARVRSQLEILSGVRPGDPQLVAVRERGRVAAQAFLATLEGRGPGPEPFSSPGPSGSALPPPTASPSPRSSAPGATPGDSGGPQASPSPRAFSSPGGQGGAPSPGATQGPDGSGNPTPGGSGSGSPGGGATPRASNGPGSGSG